MINHKPVSIADQIFEQLEKDILSGKYSKGEIISETRLSEELGVSRTPIREALHRLEQEHLVEDGSRGLEIVGISKEDVLDLIEIRVRLEGLSAYRAAENISDDMLKEMEETLEMQRFYIERHTDTDDRSDRIKDADSDFHRLLHKACGSVILYDVLEPVQMKITKFRKASLSRKSRALESLNEHIAIYAALKEHDAKKAEELTVLHARNAMNNILEFNGEEG